MTYNSKILIRSIKKAWLRPKIFILILSVIVSACVMLPYKPDSEVSLSDKNILPPTEMWVTTGPGELLEKVSKAIEKADKRIELFDPNVFRETAFPDGDWRISRLFQEGNCKRVSNELGLDYLVLVGKMEEVRRDEKNYMIVATGFFGAYSAETEARLSAIVVDLKKETPLYEVSSSARGNENVVGYVFLVLSIPQTGSSTIEGLGEKIAETIMERSSAKKVGIAVLAIEEPVDYTDPTENSPLFSGISEEERYYRAQQAAKAKKGDASAQLQLYFNILELDRIAAHRWLCKSADQGHPEARYRLAMLYMNGNEGIEKNYAMAYLWYTLAGKSGNTLGEQHALRLKTEYLSPDLLSQAEKRVKNWKSGQCEIDLGFDL